MPQTPDLLEKLAEILLYNFHRELILLKLKIRKLLRKIKSKNLTAGVFFFFFFFFSFFLALLKYSVLFCYVIACFRNINASVFILVVKLILRLKDLFIDESVRA